MDIRIIPRRLSGAVTPPPSKSMAHRLIIAATLSSGESTLKNIAFSQDIEATLRCMRALGAAYEHTADGTLRIQGIAESTSNGELPRFDCGESGSTLRFLIPIALALCGGGIFTGHGRLMQRPQKPYFDLFDEKGIFYEQIDNELTVRGTLPPGEYRLPGNVSSQFFTGLLFALPLLDGESRIVSTTALESSDYITMTVNALAASGIHIARTDVPFPAFHISPAAYQRIDATVEADWSQGAFWYAAKFLNNPITVTGLRPGSAQGDKVVALLYEKMSASGDMEIDLSACPDLLPPLAVMAAVRDGNTDFVGAARLRIKESDRLATVCALLHALGVAAEEAPDSLLVHGGKQLQGGYVDGANDHRIVMAAAIAATVCSAPITIRGAEAVRKSYPDFWEVYESLGGEVHVL